MLAQYAAQPQDFARPRNAGTTRQMAPTTTPTPSRHPTPRRVTRRNTYAVRIRSHRMRDCNLFAGDVIIIRRFQHGGGNETASAEINRRPVALKRLSIHHDGLHLTFAHADDAGIFLHNRDIEVLSLVMGIEQHATEH